jgi:hypothetical protein
MNLDNHVNRLYDQLAAAADAGGDEARALAHRLTAPLGAAVRLMLFEVLADAAAEITRELAPGSVEVRLRGSDPEFVVSMPSVEAGGAVPGDGAQEGWDATVGEGAMARINLRLSDQLKGRVEQAAEREGLSINAWLVRAAAAAVERGEVRTAQPGRRAGQRYTGWGR